MREKAIETYFKRKVEELGVECRKLEWIGRRGAPDRLIMFDGKAIFVELKQEKGVLEDHQRREHERLRKAGMRVYTLYGKQEVEAFLCNLYHEITKK